MIREYSLFYYYHKIHDELVVRFCDEEITYESQIDNVKVSYHNVDLVSYEISDITDSNIATSTDLRQDPAPL